MLTSSPYLQQGSSARERNSVGFSFLCLLGRSLLLPQTTRDKARQLPVITKETGTSLLLLFLLFSSEALQRHTADTARRRNYLSHLCVGGSCDALRTIVERSFLNMGLTYRSLHTLSSFLFSGTRSSNGFDTVKASHSMLG